MSFLYKIFFALLLAGTAQVYAQTHFTPSPSSGCLPLTVNFTNNNPSFGYVPVSGQTTGFKYLWNFGNGTTSTLENPPAVFYASSDTFNVSYNAVIDTIGFYITQVYVTAIGCTDPFWDDPDVYIEIFDGSNTKIYTCESEAQSGQYNGIQPPITYPLNIKLNNPPYRIKVLDEDGTSSNDNCGSNSNGVNISLPANDSTGFGTTTTTYTDGPLTFSTTIQKFVFQFNDHADIIVEGGPNVNMTNAIYCLGESITPLIATGSNITWYNDSLLTNLIHTGDTLNLDTLTQSGTYNFYAFQTGSPCNLATHTQIKIAPQGPSVNIPYAIYNVGQPIPTLTASGQNIKWYADVQLTQLIQTGGTYNVTAMQVGVYNYYVTQTIGGEESCPTTATVVITTSSTGFSYSNNLGCDSLTVNFVNNNPSNNYQPLLWQTTGYSYSWDFGNGQNSGLEQPGSVLYDIPGTYNVTYEAVIDTIGFYLTAIHINAIGCDDPNIWPTTNDPDIYIQLFDGNNNMVVNTYNQADNNTTPPNAADVLFTMNVHLNNPPYYLRVKDKDSGDGDDNCIDGNEHDAATAIYYPVNDPSTFGTSTVSYTNNLLGFTCTYNKVVTVINDTAVITVNPSPQPPSTNFSDTLFCNPAFVPDLTAGGSNVNWYADSALTQHLQQGNPLDFTEVNDGTYSYFVTQTSSGGCESQAQTVTVTIGDLPVPVPALYSSMYCSNEQIPPLTVPGIQVTWFSDSILTQQIHSGNSMNIQSLATGDYTYYVIQQDTNQGCQSDFTTISFSIRTLDFDVFSTDVSCYGTTDGSAEVQVNTGQPPYTYLWSNNDSLALANNLQPGEYTVVVVDGNYCLRIKSLDISEPDSMSVTSEIKNTKCERNEGFIKIDVNGGTAPYTFKWSNDLEDKDLLDINAGNYVVQIKDVNQCEKVMSFTVDDGCLDIPGVITPNADGINDTWLIGNIGFYPDVIVEVFDRWGKRVFNSKGYETPWDGTFDGNPLPVGSYFYVINYNNNLNKPLTGVVDIVY